MNPHTLATLRNWAGLVLALFILNFALSFHNVWPTLGITTRNELSVEIAVLVLFIALYTRFIHAISSRVVTVLALILTLMTIARYVEVTAPALYGRRVNLYWDAQYLPHVAEMIAKVANPLLVVAVAFGAFLILAAIFIALRIALLRVSRGASGPLEQRVMAGIAGIFIIGYTLGHIDQPVHTLRYFSLPISKTYWEQAQFISAVLANEADEVLPASEPLGNFELAGLGGADVIVQFIESYGATAYETPAIASAIAPSREQLASSIRDTGRRVVSAFIRSPTFGGNSWLSHSSFMTGLEIKHLSTYDLLLTQDRPTLSDRFSSMGYRPVALMPGLRADWPEGAFYGFAQIYGAKEIDYSGPEFGWWRIPDQFSLARMDELELVKTARAPLFLLFTTITPHMPFRPTPPYQPDWSQLLSETPFDAPALLQSLALKPEWTNLQPAYAGTLAYTFTYLGGFLREHPDRDIVWAIIGDHQPPAAVSGQNLRWDVPVHIISSNNIVIERLLQQGFVEGMTPGDATISTMHELPVTLLTSFAE